MNSSPACPPICQYTTPAKPMERLIQTVLQIAASLTVMACAFLLKTPRSIARTARTPTLKAKRSAPSLTDALSANHAAGVRGRQRSAPLQRVANVEQYLEVELFPSVGEVERRHLRLVASLARPVEGLCVHLVKILENVLTRAGHQVLWNGICRQDVAVPVDARDALQHRFRITTLEDELPRRAESEPARVVGSSHAVQLKLASLAKEGARTTEDRGLCGLRTNCNRRSTIN